MTSQLGVRWDNQRFLDSLDAHRNTLIFCGLGLGTIVYAIMFRSCQHLPTAVFDSAWMAPNVVTTRWGIVVLGAALTSLFLSRKLTWNEIDARHEIRFICFSAMAVMMWSLVTYDHNFFLGRSHSFDRALLVATAIATWWRPGFIGFFIFQLGCLIGHLSVPLNLSWTDKALPIDTILLAQAFVCFASVLRLRTQHFLVAILFVVAVHYLRPAAGKFTLNWVSENDLSRLYLSAVFQNGWTGFVDHSHVGKIAEGIRYASQPMMYATLVIEMLPIAFLFNRKVILLTLSGAVLMHIGIFVSSGIMFWKWVVVDIAIMFVAGTLMKRNAAPLFGIQQGVLFAVLTFIGSWLYITAPVLAWLDAPIAVRYQIEVIGESDKAYEIPPHRLAPFDLQFAQGRLGFLDSEPLLVDCLGCCVSKTARDACERVQSLSDLRAARASNGSAIDYAGSTDGLTRLIRGYVRTTPSRRRIAFWDYLPDPPQHIWTYGVSRDLQPTWDWQEPAARIRIRRQTAIHQPNRTKLIEDQVLLDVGV